MKKSSSLLFKKDVILINPRLATLVGLNEAIVLQQVEYWLEKNQEKHDAVWEDGRVWMYNSYPEWQKQFPWWSIVTIKRTITVLEEKGFLLSRQSRGFDHTKHYTINYDKLNELEDYPSVQIDPIDGIIPPSDQSDLTDGINLIPSIDSKRSHLHITETNESETTESETTIMREDTQSENPQPLKITEPSREESHPMQPCKAEEPGPKEQDRLCESDFPIEEYFEDLEGVMPEPEEPRAPPPRAKLTVLSLLHGEGDEIKNPGAFAALEAFEARKQQTDLSHFPPDILGLAEAFVKASGLVPGKSVFSFWIKGLRRLREEGLGPDEIRSAVGEMRRQNLTIKSPASIEAVALDAKAKRKTGKNRLLFENI